MPAGWIFSDKANAIGYIEKLPYRKPSADLEAAVAERSRRIVSALREDPAADIDGIRYEVDELIFDLFDIGESRQHVRHVYRTLDRADAEPTDQATSE